jgi:hypothetical protein
MHHAVIRPPARELRSVTATPLVTVKNVVATLGSRKVDEPVNAFCGNTTAITDSETLVGNLRWHPSRSRSRCGQHKPEEVCASDARFRVQAH